MKSHTHFLTICFMLMFCHISVSQTQDTVITSPQFSAQEETVYKLPEIFTTDNNLKLIGQFIPENWKVFQYNDTLKFINCSPVYRITEEVQKDTLKKGRTTFKSLTDSKPDTVYIEFLIQPLWSGQKVDDAKFKNSHNQALINKLPSRFKISHLTDSLHHDSLLMNQMDSFSEKEQKSIQRYLEEKGKIQKDLILTPDFHTSKYSLFIHKIYPAETENQLFTPPGMILEIDLIIDLFEKYAGK